MTLRHLTIFRAVCQTESITLAAEHLNMTQPAVSLAVRELEDFYGVQLFERMNRRIYITEAGRTLLQYADTILSQYAESVQVLQEARHRGSCRFGVHVTFGETVLPSLLRRLAEQLPDITVRAFVTNTRENEEMLLRNELDFAVIDNVKGLEALRTVPLGKEEMAVVCRPDHRSGNSITLEELAEHIKGNALCGLGQTAPNPVLSTMKNFRDEYIAHVVEKRCPAGHCKKLSRFIIDPEKCKGCSACARKCPVGAIEGVVRSPYKVDQAKCIKCGTCIEACKFGAISKK